MPDGDFRHLPPELSAQQREASDAIHDWWRGRSQVFRIDGHAGAGKTEVAVRIGIELGAQFAAFTGKAASVLRARGAGNATTLHSLLYGPPVVDDDGELIWHRRDASHHCLIVADECSTIERKLGQDLRRTGARLLLTGDPNQLPPVNGRPFFDGEPDFTLTEIHRQAAGSQPLQIATAILAGDLPEPVSFDLDAVAEADVVISAMNRTRKRLNCMIRRKRGIAGKGPVAGDRVVALRTNHTSGVLNGTLWAVEAAERDEALWHMNIADDIGNAAAITAHNDGFALHRLDVRNPDYEDLALFDHGFCLTARKSQGSEWHKVVVIDETDSPGFKFIAGDTPVREFRKRWLYTASTRARSSVVLMEAPR